MLKWITAFTQEIENCAIKAGFMYRFASRYYKNIIESEAILANVTEKDHILCVGGGVCPFSAILFHQLTGAKVTVIDNNMDCIPKAKQIISRLGLEEQIFVYCQDGRCAEIPFSEYTVVHLALQVSPMESVFAQIESRLAPGTRLMIRRPKKQLCNAYCRLFSNLLSCCAYTTHHARNVGSTLLYIKQGYSNERQLDCVGTHNHIVDGRLIAV